MAQWKAQQAAKRPKEAKLAGNARLRAYVEDKLAGAVTDVDGRPIAGPNVPWAGRRHGRRQDRRWGTCWSPEQISRRLPLDFPDDESMRISHETIYQALYVQGRGALKRELTACLRTGRALREPRARTRRSGRSFVTDEVKFSQRRQREQSSHGQAPAFSSSVVMVLASGSVARKVTLPSASITIRVDRAATWNRWERVALVSMVAGTCSAST